jgi:serine/threonine protein phosphatase 1
MFTYAIGDIHGQIGALKSLINKLNLTPDDHVIFLGDYIDWGPDWFAVIKFIDELKSVCKITVLQGNHEEMMLISINRLSQDKIFDINDEDLDTIAHWMRLGGVETIDSFIKLSAEDKQFITNFLKELIVDTTVDINDDSYVLCHALPGDVGKTIHDSLWARLKFDYEGKFYYESFIDIDTLMSKYENKIIVHGHSPVMEYSDPDDKIKAILYQIKNVKFINIDTGCTYMGKNPGVNLCAFRLDDEAEFYAF